MLMSGSLQNIYFVKEGPDNWKLRTLTQIKNGKVHDIRLLSHHFYQVVKRMQTRRIHTRKPLQRVH